MKTVTERVPFNAVMKMFECRKILKVACNEHLAIQLTCLNVCVQYTHYTKKPFVSYKKICTKGSVILLCEKCFRITYLKQCKYLPCLIFDF